MYKGKKAAASTGDQERRPGLGSVGGVSPVCAPPGLSHRSRGTPAGLGVFPSDCPGARTRQAMPRGPRGRGQGSQSQSAARGGPARGPLPAQSLLCSFPRSSGSEGGRPRWSPDPSFPSQASGQDRWRPLRGDPLAEGWTDGRVEGRGKHHWPSESGIETDGRGEQYYHSKDPMGAIQQIPY